MKKLKTHYEVVSQPPNESDPAGWSWLLCGREVAEKMTTNRKAVTCKHCLSRLGAQED